MAIKATINEIEYLIPTSWEDVTLKQYADMLNHNISDSARLMSILTGIDYKVLINYDLSQFDMMLLDHLQFINDTPDLYSTWEHRAIDIAGKKIEPPTSIDSKTWYQRSVLKQAVDGFAKVEANNKLKQYPSLVNESITIYMQPMVSGDGKVDSEKYDQVRKDVWMMNVQDCYQLAGFFLSNYVHFSRERSEN